MVPNYNLLKLEKGVPHCLGVYKSIKYNNRINIKAHLFIDSDLSFPISMTNYRCLCGFTKYHLLFVTFLLLFINFIWDYSTIFKLPGNYDYVGSVGTAIINKSATIIYLNESRIFQRKFFNNHSNYSLFNSSKLRNLIFPRREINSSIITLIELFHNSNTSTSSREIKQNIVIPRRKTFYQDEACKKYTAGTSKLLPGHSIDNSIYESRPWLIEPEGLCNNQTPLGILFVVSNRITPERRTAVLI